MAGTILGVPSEDVDAALTAYAKWRLLEDGNYESLLGVSGSGGARTVGDGVVPPPGDGAAPAPMAVPTWAVLAGVGLLLSGLLLVVALRR